MVHNFVIRQHYMYGIFNLVSWYPECSKTQLYSRINKPKISANNSSNFHLHQILLMMFPQVIWCN
jgi:hypothetical protein